MRKSQKNNMKIQGSNQKIQLNCNKKHRIKNRSKNWMQKIQSYTKNQEKRGTRWRIIMKNALQKNG